MALKEIDHDWRSDDCPCEPQIEPVERDDGSFGWVIIHKSVKTPDFLPHQYN